MPISEVFWPEARVDHSARHGVTPAEFEQVCVRLPFVLRAKATGQNPVYYLLGETDAGRPPFCVVIECPGSKAYPATARDMTTKEKRRYAEWKKP